MPSPVSYTHLDVYKRQSPNLAGAKVLLFRDYSQTKSEINFNEFCNSLKNMVLLNGSGCGYRSMSRAKLSLLSARETG